MIISELLSEKVINIHLDAKDKNESIDKMIDLASNMGTMIDKKAVRECVFNREKLVSTGVGKGFAIPHGKTDGIKDITASFAILDKPIDFDSIDMEPVRFIFLLLGKESMLNAHIKLLSRISRLMNKDEFRGRLLKAKSPAEVLKMFREEERHYVDL